jgi:hypothetical protein
MAATYTDFDRPRFGECLLLNLPFLASAENGVEANESFIISMKIRRPTLSGENIQSRNVEGQDMNGYGTVNCIVYIYYGKMRRYFHFSIHTCIVRSAATPYLILIMFC